MRSLRIFLGALLVAAAGLALVVSAAWAHTTVHAGKYDVEVGWVDEPPVVGQRNAIVVNVSNNDSADAQVDVSRLSLDVTYGAQTKTLTLEPLGENTRNQYIAPILPTVPGLYTIQLRGQLDSTSISQDVQPEEVAPAEALAFPSLASEPAQGGAANPGPWLGAAGLVAGLAGLIIAILALRRRG